MFKCESHVKYSFQLYKEYIEEEHDKVEYISVKHTRTQHRFIFLFTIHLDKCFLSFHIIIKVIVVSGYDHKTVIAPGSKGYKLKERGEELQ